MWLLHNDFPREFESKTRASNFVRQGLFYEAGKGLSEQNPSVLCEQDSCVLLHMDTFP